MAYSKQNFQNGQTLDAANLEIMENGIIAGQGVKNLLINSNFKDPINSGGKTSWSASGFTIDKWRTDSAVTVNLTSSGITVDATSVAGNFQQNIDNLPNGTYTFAALVNNVIRTIVFTNNNGTITTIDNSNASFGDSGSISAGKESNTYYVQINNIQGHTNTIAWAALYEGNYAVDTLPNYIPKDKHIEMSNCGISAQPCNLFDNSNFSNPVNSRNIISTSDAGYHIDRWKKDNTNGTVIVGDGYLEMNGTGAQWFLTQHISTDKIKSGTVYTIALADTSGSISVCSTVMSTNMAKFTAQHTFANGAVVTTNVEYTSNKYSVYFTSNSDARTRFAWAALYEGFYTADTLPPYVPKDRNVEMVNCGIPLQPENLLVNSDFSDPIAPKGLNSRESYTTPGTLYLCDGWIGSENITAEQQSDGIKLTTTGSSYITKYLNLQIGKTYTLALCASNISSQHRIELYDTETYSIITSRASSDEILAINFRNSYDKIMMAYYPGYTNEGGSSVLKWAALYEGSYTAETLPGYVPKDKYIEMLNCGVSLAPHNILDNSDFRDPINSQGKPKYTGDTNAIDKWALSGGSASTLTLVNRYARLAAGQESTAVLTQYISGLRDGVYTQAVNLAGTIYTRIIKLSGSTITTIDDSNATYDSGHIDCSVDSSGNYSFNFNTSNGIDILWAALYEGAYTIDTLPSYIPKDRRVEMINCGISLQPQNLLDNSDFSNPVNSRGKNTYSDEGNEYTIDRWKTGYKTNISIENGYINIFGHWRLEQYIQNPKDGIYTFAARIRINSSKNTPVIYVDDNSGSSNDLFLDANIGEWKTYILQHDFSSTTGETITFAFSLRGGDTTASISVEWAAMYKGAYTADTLPPYVPKGKHVEMLNCGISLTPKNLLVNSDFRNPIDIDNKIGTVNVNPCFTRWNFERANSNTTTQIIKTDNGIRVYKKGGVARFYQFCNYNLLGKTVSYAVGTAEGVFVGSCSVSTNSVYTQIGTHTGYLSVYHGSETTFSLYFNDNSEDAIDLYWAALYEGAYTKETLPNYVPNLGLEENILSQVITQPENFVLNNNFIDPINSQFQTTYTNNVSSSTTFYTIDKWELGRWSSDGSGTAALTLRSDGIYLHGGTDSNDKPNSCNLYQIIDVNDKMYGVPFTAVLHTTVSTHDNAALFRIWDADTVDSFGSMNVKTGYNIINFTIPSTCSRLAIGFGSMASYGGHGQISIVAQYAALYKGKYTIENLPTYTPYTKQMEMLRCGIPTSPRNVLKNSDFTHPLNTKGFSSMSSGSYITIDCWNSWISGNGGKIELTSSGIKLSPPSSENIGIYQQIENYQLNKIYTVVVYINDLPYLKSFQMGNYGVGTNFGPVYFYSIPSANVLIRINSTDSEVTIQKVALYEGAYTLDTIPMYQSESKHIEMLNCNVPLAPYNLLDNSDFRIKNNIINTKGLTDYSFDSGNVFDRWRLHWTGDGRVSIKDGYIELYRKTNSVYLFQHPKDLESMTGKTYTVAAKVRYNGYIGWIDSTQRVNCGLLSLDDWDIVTLTFTVGSATSDIGKAGIEIATKADLSFEVQWVALYEGAYTKETLPVYITKDKHVEMLNCGVPLTPHNLLDNSNFSDIVAQAGLNGSHGGTAYLADRWIGSADITPTANTDGILLATTNHYAFIQQRVRLTRGKTYTLALSTTGGTTMQRIAVFNIGLTEIFASVEGSNGVIIATFEAAYDDMAMLFYPGYADVGGSAVFKWAALYEGSYTADTLPAYQPKGYAAELAECQRYYWHYWQNNNMSVGNGYMNTTDTANITFEFPTKMRVAPTISIENISTLRMMCVDGLKGVTAYSVVKSTYNRMMVGFTLNSASTAFTPCTLRSNSGAKIEFSADL